MNFEGKGKGLLKGDMHKDICWYMGPMPFFLDWSWWWKFWIPRWKGLWMELWMICYCAYTRQQLEILPGTCWRGGIWYILNRHTLHWFKQHLYAKCRVARSLPIRKIFHLHKPGIWISCIHGDRRNKLRSGLFGVVDTLIWWYIQIGGWW